MSTQLSHITVICLQNNNQICLMCKKCLFDYTQNVIELQLDNNGWVQSLVAADVFF